MSIFILSFTHIPNNDNHSFIYIIGLTLDFVLNHSEPLYLLITPILNTLIPLKPKWLNLQQLLLLVHQYSDLLNLSLNVLNINSILILLLNHILYLLFLCLYIIPFLIHFPLYLIILISLYKSVLHFVIIIHSLCWSTILTSKCTSITYSWHIVSIVLFLSIL